MRIAREVAWGVLLSAILTAALLRHFNDSTPQAQWLPWPISSLLFLLLVILFLLFLKSWGQRQELPYAGSSLEEFNFLAMVPFLIALVGEKWFSITFYAPVLQAASRAGLPDAALDTLTELLAGLGIIAVGASVLPLFPRLWPLLREYLSVRALLIGITATITALTLMYGLIGAGLLMLGARDVFLVPRWFGSWAGIRFSGQSLIALGEELYYRGILQSELIFLLPALGLRLPSTAISAGVGILSLQFALEHVGGAAGGGQIPVFVYTLAVALFLGTLLVTLRSLYLCAATHFALNVFVLSGGLQFTDRTGRPIIEPRLYVTIFLVLMTLLIYCRYAPERREILRQRARRRQEAATR